MREKPIPKSAKAAKKALRAIVAAAQTTVTVRPDVDAIRQARADAMEQIIANGNKIGDLADSVLIRILEGKIMADPPLVSALRLAMARAGRLMPEPSGSQDDNVQRVLVVRMEGAAGTLAGPRTVATEAAGKDEL